MDVGVVARHVLIDSPHRVPGHSQPRGELGILGGDQVGGVAPERAEGVDPNQDVPSESDIVEIAEGRRDPFEVTEPVVDRGLRIPLPPPATDRCTVRVRIMMGHRGLEPARNEGAVSVDELNCAELGFVFARAGESGIACTRGREGGLEIELDDRDPAASGELSASVRRTTVDVDDRPHVVRNRIEALPQSVTLVATDQNDADLVPAEIRRALRLHASIPLSNPGRARRRTIDIAGAPPPDEAGTIRFRRPPSIRGAFRKAPGSSIDRRSERHRSARFKGRATRRRTTVRKRPDAQVEVHEVTQMPIRTLVRRPVSRDRMRHKLPPST